ncbi:hypothetical protein AVEN_152402-1 [Araneus ventricosus]|uniref:K Homology domain-containing protein n=1 Tax=Araneus ventricosus TaxID=182803 RepID=A0A4Y2U2K9_ARAVE|nr:hypothetical protein AVEN_152402-1 [Araneus ventricosus]
MIKFHTNNFTLPDSKLNKTKKEECFLARRRSLPNGLYGQFATTVETYDVNIIIPHQNEQSDVITIKGPPENVAKAKEALKERIGQLELEKQDRLLRSFQLTVEVNPQYHPKIVGHTTHISLLRNVT